MLKLSPRLFAAASLVRGGGSLCDVGTDHAYLPIYLINEGRVSFALAVDIGAMPLNNAAASVAEYGLGDKISLRISDGLSAVLPSEADEFVFAGMGGTLIVKILEAAPWLKDEKYHLVFQPQSRAEELRQYLFDNAYSINTELAVNEGKRYYIAFDAVYNGVKAPYLPKDCFIGGLPHNECAKMHLKNQLKRVREKYDALVIKGETAETERLSGIINGIQDFLND